LRRPELRFTVDERPDFELIQEIYHNLYQPGSLFSLNAAVQFVDARPEIKRINNNIVQRII
jgi:spore coat polysaccharide biosynthesis protein SpsF (cytidylyltransferase family)